MAEFAYIIYNFEIFSFLYNSPIFDATLKAWEQKWKHKLFYML